MNPAPPVTRMLATRHLREDVVQPRAPVHGREVQDFTGHAAVEHAVRRTRRRAAILAGARRPEVGRATQETALEGLLLDRACEVVPARDSGIGPMQHAAELRSL